MTKLTVIIPTFNEESNIQRALDSVGFSDEIIVIDSYSTDNTVSIVEKTRAKLIQRKFDDFSTQKNYAIQQAANDWIFILDADEEVTDSLQKEILEKIKNETKYVGYSVNRSYYFLEKRIRYSGFKRNSVIRLFDRRYCRYNGNLVHETIQADGNLGCLDNILEHWSYKDFNHHLKKIHFYRELQAKQLFSKGKKATLYHILFKPFSRFMSHYIIKLGFLDGFPGLVIAVTQAYGIFIKFVYLKLFNEGIK